MIPLTQVPRVVKVTVRKQNGGCQRLWEGEIGSYCLMGTQFQFGKMKKFGRWTMVMVYVFNAMELYT